MLLNTTAAKPGHIRCSVGAGTSGRLGVLDASECLPTYNSEQVTYLTTYYVFCIDISSAFSLWVSWQAGMKHYGRCA